MTVSIGIVGAGRGLRFGRFLRQLGGSELVGICDSASDGQERAQKFFPDTRVLTSYEELLAIGPDAVVIASPPHLHAAQAEAALDHGISVLSEVPAVVDLDQAHRLIAQDFRTSPKSSCRISPLFGDKTS